MRPRREPLVEHQIDEHPGDRDIEPDRDGPARDPCVPVPSTTKNRNERQNHERQGHKGKENMGSQHREVNRGEPPGVSRRFLADVRMISDVANEKTDRRGQGRDHARHVTAPRAAPDEIPAHGNEDRAHEIERGIQGRQIGD